jgi:hypothetical protein
MMSLTVVRGDVYVKVTSRADEVGDTGDRQQDESDGN